MSHFYGSRDGRLHKAFTCVDGWVVAEYLAHIGGKWMTLEQPHLCSRCGGAGCHTIRVDTDEPPEQT